MKAALFIFLFYNILPVIIVCLLIYTEPGVFLSNYLVELVEFDRKESSIFLILILLSMEVAGCVLLISAFIKNIILRIRKKKLNQIEREKENRS